MLNKLKEIPNVNSEAKEFFKVILFSILVCICLSVMGTIGYFYYNPPQSKIGGFLLALSYGLLVGYVFGSWWPSKFKRYFNKLVGKTNRLDSHLENDSLYEFIKINPAKFPPELSNHLVAWKAENDEKEKNKIFRKLTALFELCCENQDTRVLSKSSKTTYEKIIGTLLETCISKGATESQSTITEDIIDLYQVNTKDKYGLSQRNIAEIFSEANRIHEAAVIRRSHMK